MDLQAKLQIVLTKTANHLPVDIGNYLLTMLTPHALVTMSGVLIVWGSAHFFGVGEIADVILLCAGWVAIGGVALNTGKLLYTFAIKTINAKTEDELEDAARDLSEAIMLVGVNTIFVILLKAKPADTFKRPFRGASMPQYSNEIAKRMSLPRNGGWRYTPTIKITKYKDVEQGATKIWGVQLLGVTIILT